MANDIETKNALTQLIKTLDRFDETLTDHKKFCQKVGDVANSVDRLVAVHEERLNEHERIMAEFRVNLESIKKDIYIEIKEMSNDSKKSRIDINNRIAYLEKWRWLVVGAATCIGVLVHFIVTLFKNLHDISQLPGISG